MTIEVVQVGPGDGLERARAIRRDVFLGEFAVTGEEEFDDLDDLPTTVHVVAVDGDDDLGTARLIVDPTRPGVAHITRVAVQATARKRGVGRALMQVLEDLAFTQCAVGDPPQVRLELSVMEDAAGFYRSLGYVVDAARYQEVRIWHRAAHKVVASGSAGVAR